MISPPASFTVGLLVLVWSTRAMALDLDWVAPPECPPAPVIELPGRAKVTIEQRTPSLWQLVILFQEPNAGERRLDATTCQDTVAAATLLLKLGLRGSAPRKPLEQAFSSPTEPPIVEEPARGPAVGLLVSVAAQAEVALFSSPVVRPALSIDVIRGPLTLAAAVRIAPWLGAIGSNVEISRPFEADFAGCFMPTVEERVSLGACAALIVGFWRLAGRNLPLIRVANSLHLAAEPQLRIRVALVSALFISATAAVRFNLVRPQAVADGKEVIFTPPLLSGTGQLALGWQW